MFKLFIEASYKRKQRVKNILDSPAHFHHSKSCSKKSSSQNQSSFCLFHKTILLFYSCNSVFCIITNKAKKNPSWILPHHFHASHTICLFLVNPFCYFLSDPTRKMWCFTNWYPIITGDMQIFLLPSFEDYFLLYCVKESAKTWIKWSCNWI